MIPTIAFIILIAGLAVQSVFLLREKTNPDRFSHYLLLASALLLFAATVQRSVRIRFPALTGIFESLLFFSGIIALVLFVYRVKAGENTPPFIVFIGTLFSVILLAVASSPLTGKNPLPPVPALRSHWLVLHVSFALIGEAFFTLGFAASVYYLVSTDKEKRRRADRTIYRAIGIGYPLFTAGALIFGAIWAQYAWGSYWSWDPKETWALVTWVVYTVYLHVRIIMKKSGKTPAFIAIIGFAFTMFTYFGVNYLLTGLHSYG